MTGLLLGALVAVAGVLAALTGTCGPEWLRWWRARQASHRAAALLAQETADYCATALEDQLW